MVWIRYVGCEKLQRDFMARTFALIASFQYVLQQVSCSYEMIPDAPKSCEKDWNISLGSNGVDWVCSLRKILTWICGMIFCINCTSSPRFAPSFMQLRNDPKCTQTIWNTPKHEFGVQLGGSGAFVAKKIKASLRGTNFCINCTSLVYFAPTFMHLRNDPNSPQILRIAPKH